MSVDYLQFINIDPPLTNEVRKEILGINKKIGSRAIEIYDPTEEEPDVMHMINIDADKCSYPVVEQMIKNILDKHKIKYLVSSAG